MKELVEKINALYAEFEKDATAQADKGADFGPIPPSVSVITTH